jgi:hypothetical protein
LATEGQVALWLWLQLWLRLLMPALQWVLP